MSFQSDKLFQDRHQAGKLLAGEFSGYKFSNPIILALPRGGVPVAYEIALLINVRLDVFIVRKIGSPENPEFGIGAIAEDGTIYLDHKIIEKLAIGKKEIAQIIKKEQAEINRRKTAYRGESSLPVLQGKDIIIVDDGLATGVTARVAIKAIKKCNPKQIIYASPVCSYNTALELGEKPVYIVCLHSARDMRAIGEYYMKFDQINDEEVVRLLKSAKRIIHREKSEA